MADAPQLRYDPEELEVTEIPNPYDQPELKQHSHQVPSNPNKTGAYYGNGRQEKLICGLNQQAFWFVIIVAVIVIIAAVGGGVGSSLAIRNSKSKSEVNPTTTTQYTRLESSAPSASIPSTLTRSPATNTKATFVPPIATSIVDIGSRCPSDIVTSFDGRYHFKCYDTADFGDGIIAALIAYSVQDCVQACAATNRYLSNQGKKSCMGVTIYKNLINSINANHGPNCWLKEESIGGFGNGKIDNTTSLTLCATPSCADL